jgi:FMNH2-dependent dimethyl sulfone monooxygenase
MVRRIALACPRFRGSNWNLMENILLDRPASMRDRIAMYNANALKIGVFGANCSSGRSATKVPERWSASWPDCLRLARMADEAGIDFMLPIARWKGYGGETDFHGSTLETITWAVGLLSATQRMTVFGTVHAPLFHPLIAAKELVTADHVGEGRLGLNLVVGWNEGEFDMFGVTQREHAARYEFAFFVATAGSRTSLEGNAKKVTEIKRAAQNVGREIEVYTVGQVICRPSQKEAEDYYRHAVIENADWGAIDGMLANKSITPQTIPPDEYYKKRQYFASHAIGGYPFVGTPDRVADELESISKAGVRGIALSFVNYLDELPYFCAEVLPRLVRLGARSGVPASHFS